MLIARDSTCIASSYCLRSCLHSLLAMKLHSFACVHHNLLGTAQWCIPVRLLPGLRVMKGSDKCIHLIDMMRNKEMDVTNETGNEKTSAGLAENLSQIQGRMWPAEEFSATFLVILVYWGCLYIDCRGVRWRITISVENVKNQQKGIFKQEKTQFAVNLVQPQITFCNSEKHFSLCSQLSLKGKEAVLYYFFVELLWYTILQCSQCVSLLLSCSAH